MQRKITSFFDSTTESESRLSEITGISRPQSCQTSHQHAVRTMAETLESLMNVHTLYILGVLS